jgi:putative colanic acid biosynthesis UDP-glucose lipid carrier transferase
VTDIKLQTNLKEESHLYISLSNKYAKRGGDIIFSLLVIIFLLSWLIPIMGILIILDSKGAVFYTQDRTGLLGSKFKIFKFRSMAVNEQNKDLQHSLGYEDPRITRIGRFLRKTRFDELPQFINVLLGDMSIVGPRPLADYDSELLLELVPQYYLKSLQVKPGITSMGQIKLGYVVDKDEMVKRLRYDLVYLSKMSFWLDCKIILKTVIVMLKGHGK